MDVSDDEILSSTTLESLNNFPFKYSLLVSTGILIPFIVDEVYAWINGMLPSGIDSYLLPILMVIMQFFNLYWISEGKTTCLFWDFQMGVCIEVVVLYNIVLALQINLVHHSPEVIYTLIASTVLFNCGLICKVYSLSKWSPLSYVWITLWCGSIVCNLYVAFSWFNLYLATKKLCLSYSQHFYAFVMIFILIIFLSINLILYLMKIAFTFDNMSDTGLVLQQTLLMCSFYGIIELNAILLKHQAHASMVSKLINIKYSPLIFVYYIDIYRKH